MKDILLDIQERDLILSNQNKYIRFRRTSWGSDDNDYCYLNIESEDNENVENVYTDTEERPSYVFADSSVYVPLESSNIYFTAKYHPSVLKVKIVFDGVEYPVKTKFWDGQKRDVKACQFPIINISGKYMIQIAQEEDDEVLCAYLYNADELDFTSNESQDQEAQLLALCAPGQNYRYPTVGIDVSKYVNSVPSLTDLGQKIVNEFSNDGKDVYNADFDADTGNITVEFNQANTTQDVSETLNAEDYTESDLIDMAEKIAVETTEINDSGNDFPQINDNISRIQKYLLI